MSAIVQVKSLTRIFKNTKAVDDISFEANEGEIFGLLGPNGAGKTTTIRLISTILKPTSGTAEIAGFDIIKNPVEVRRNIGVLTTDLGAYERFSGRENLEYFGNLYGLSKEKIKSRIDHLTELLEMGWFINRKFGQYSTGMKQKLAIARSVIHDPKLIIFDEPTTGLDVLASQTVLNFIRNARDLKKCVIFSTHQMPDAEKLCDKVTIILNGKSLLVDSPEKIIQETKTLDLEDAFLKIIKDRNLDSSVKEELVIKKKKGFFIFK